MANCKGAFWSPELPGKASGSQSGEAFRWSAITAVAWTIVGTGVNPATNYSEAWIATIPEPGTAGLVGWGIVALGMRERRRAHARI
jgi:hypothetical protein